MYIKNLTEANKRYMQSDARSKYEAAGAVKDSDHISKHSKVHHRKIRPIPPLRQQTRYKQETHRFKEQTWALAGGPSCFRSSSRKSSPLFMASTLSRNTALLCHVLYRHLREKGDVDCSFCPKSYHGGESRTKTWSTYGNPYPRGCRRDTHCNAGLSKAHHSIMVRYTHAVVGCLD